MYHLNEKERNERWKITVNDESEKKRDAGAQKERTSAGRREECTFLVI